MVIILKKEILYKSVVNLTEFDIIGKEFKILSSNSQKDFHSNIKDIENRNRHSIVLLE